MPDDCQTVREVTVLNKMGLHARPAALVVQCASQFDAEVSIQSGSEVASCSSILGLMILSAGMGTKLQLSASGPDAECAVKAIAKLFSGKFDEE